MAGEVPARRSDPDVAKGLVEWGPDCLHTGADLAEGGEAAAVAAAAGVEGVAVVVVETAAAAAASVVPVEG